MARIELSNIGGGGGTTLSLTTTGTSGAATLAGSVLNIPVYQGQLTLTTTGTSGAATLVGNTLNIPNYATGGTPAGSAGQIQFNSTPAGSFAASANLAWDNGATQLNIGAPSAPTGRLNVNGGGTLSSTVNLRLTNSGNTELLKVLDNGSTNIGTGFNWDNANGRLGVGTSTPSYHIHHVGVAGVAGVVSVRDFSFNSLSQISQRASFIGHNTDTNIGVAFGGVSNGGQIQGYSQLPATAVSGLIFQPLGGNVAIGFTSSSNARLHVRGTNTTSGTNAFLVQNSTPSDLYKIENNGKITYWATNTAAGTTGAQTIDRPSGTVNFGIGASSLVVTNSLCTTASLVFAEVRTNDATAQIKNVVPAAGSFTINLVAAATAETSVGFFIIN